MLVTNGGKHAVYNTFATLLDPGDEVLLPAPVLDHLPRADRAGRRRAGGAPDRRDHRLPGHGRPARRRRHRPHQGAPVRVAVEPHRAPCTRAAEVEAIGRWAVERGIWVITDEIYEHLTYGDHRFSSMPTLVPELRDRCVVLNGVAKTYAMTGWRVGWMIGPDDVIKAATNLQSHATSNVANVEPARRAGRRVGRPRRRRPRCAPPSSAGASTMHKLLTGIEGVTALEPQGAFYAFPNLSHYLGRSIRGRTVDHHRRAVRRAARRGQGGHRPRRGVRRARLRAPQLRARRRRPRRGLPPHRRPPRRGRVTRAATLPVRLLADADHERAGGALGRGCRTASHLDGDDVWWSEGRPEEGGRMAVLRRGADGTVDRGASPRRGTPAPPCTSTAAGPGGCATACCGSSTGPPSGSTASSPAASRCRSRPSPTVPRGLRYADGDLSPDGTTLLCVQEEHHADGREATNTIVRLAAHEPSDARGGGRGPRLRVATRAGARTARRSAGSSGTTPTCRGTPPAWWSTRAATRTVVAGGDERESIGQPTWAPDGSLWFFGDRTGFWSLYRWTPAGGVEAMVDLGQDIGFPQWVFGQSCFAFLDDGRRGVQLQRRRARAARGAGAGLRPGARRSTCRTR